MKRFSLCILVLGLLLLGACSAPDSSDTGLPSGSDGVLGQEFGDAAQTGLRNILESVEPAASSQPKQNESAAPTEAPKEPAAESPAEPPAAAQPQEPEPIAPEEPVQPPAEPEKPKTIYDYAFDANAIRSELIALGQSMGLTHITEDDGIPCTPDTCSWTAPVTASESFQGDNLKRALKDYVTSMPSMIASYGGAQLTSFTIYVQDNGGGSYTFYFLY